MSRQGSASEHTPLLSNRNDNSYDDASTPPAGESREQDIPSPSYKILVPCCFAIWVPVLVASLDSTIVATLVGSISSSFNKSEESAWLGTSYLLSVCCFTPIYGRLCDVMGRKYAMLLALSFFTAGTLLCGLATSMQTLIAARALAGIGGGGLTTCTSTILSDIIPLRNRGLYQGLTNIIYGLGSGLGGPVGGLLNDTWGWRNAFLVQIPFLAASIALCIMFVHSEPPHNATKTSPAQNRMEKFKSIDFLGSITLIGCVAPILLSLSFMSADDRSIGEPIVWSCLLGGVLSGVAFAVVETYVAKCPVLPLRLVTQRTGGSAAVANLFLSTTAFSLLYHYPLLFQATRLESSSRAGLHLIPNSVALSVGSVLAGLWMRQTGVYYRYNFANSLGLVFSTIWIATITPKTPEWVTYVAIAPGGFGISGVLTCTLLALINSVSRADMAVATGMSYMFRTTGQVIGVSTSGAILQAVLKRELRKRFDDEDLIATIRHQSSVIASLPKHYQQAAIDSYDVALRTVFLLGIATAIATSISCYFLEDRRLPDAVKTQHEDESGPGEGQ